MENEKQTENFENQLTTAAVGFLQESAKWSKFMAIIGFIGNKVKIDLIKELVR